MAREVRGSLQASSGAAVAGGRGGGWDAVRVVVRMTVKVVVGAMVSIVVWGAGRVIRQWLGW